MFIRLQQVHKHSSHSVALQANSSGRLIALAMCSVLVAFARANWPPNQASRARTGSGEICMLVIREELHTSSPLDFLKFLKHFISPLMKSFVLLTGPLFQRLNSEGQRWRRWSH